VSEIHGYGHADRALAYRLSVEERSETTIAETVSEALGALRPVVGPSLVRVRLDSYLPDLFGIADDEASVDPSTAYLVAARWRSRAGDLLDPSSGRVDEVEAITGAEMATFLNSVVTSARSTGGAGRPGVSTLETLSGRARLPEAAVTGRPSLNFTSIHGSARLLEVVDGWVEGPSEDGVVPIPLKVVIVRRDWILLLTIEVRLDVFWPIGGPVAGNLADCVATLARAGWAPVDSSSAGSG
jgi:hypothetical protein